MRKQSKGAAESSGRSIRVLPVAGSEKSKGASDRVCVEVGGRGKRLFEIAASSNPALGDLVIRAVRAGDRLGARLEIVPIAANVVALRWK